LFKSDPLGFWHKTLKKLGIHTVLGANPDLSNPQTSEQTFVRTFVVLIRNTTWRCGKLERSIVKHLHRRHENFGKSEMSVNDMMYNLNFAGEKRNEFLDALRRLERRNIVKLV
jgi:hypothetical protein